MKQDFIGTAASARLTRRSIVTTGTKLAYAAPVVAASFKLVNRGAFATGGHADCSCVAKDRSPKPGGTGCSACVGGDPTLCYTCKQDASHDYCGHQTQRDFQVIADGFEVVEDPNDDPSGVCHNSQGCQVLVNGTWHTIARGYPNVYCNGGAARGINCGGVGGISPL